MPIIIGIVIVIFLIWIFGGILSFFVHGLLAIVKFPIRLLAAIFSNHITWWIFGAIFLCAALSQCSAKARILIVAVYVLGAAGMGYLAHKTKEVTPIDAVSFTIFWPYWTYYLFEHPLLRPGHYCFGTYGEPVPCPPQMMQGSGL